MKKITDYLIGLLNRLQLLSLEVKEMFHIWRSDSYFTKWMAKKEADKKDKP